MTGPDQYLTAAASELETFVRLVDSTPPAVQVPGCDDWSVGELASHVAAVLGMIGDTCLAGAVDAPVRPAPPDDTVSIAATVSQRGRAALDALAAATPDTTMWSWADPTVAFWRRRVYFELLMHRIDVERAAGQTPVLDPTVASEAIDEFLDTYVVNRGLWKTLDGASVHVHCTDTAGEWTLRTGSGTPELTREHAKGDLALRGPAFDLAMVLYGRCSLDDTDVERFGDDVVAEAVNAWSV